MFYKNLSHSVKTFYGVEFKPGETHEVPGYINASGMVRIESYDSSRIQSCKNKPAEPPKKLQNKKSVTTVTEIENVSSVSDNTSTESNEELTKPIKEEKENGEDNH